MTLFEILDEMGNLCDTHHDILFEVNNMGVIIRKYFYDNGRPCTFNQMFSFDVFKHKDLEDCVLEFERKLEKELEKRAKANEGGDIYDERSSY